MAMAADFSDQITWYAGSYSYKTPIINMTASSFGQVNAVFEGENVDFKLNGDSFKATTTGPDNYSCTSSIAQAAEYNPVTSNIELQPAFQFYMANAPKKCNNPGQYTVNIPAGTFSINGVSNDEMNVVFTVEDNRTFTPVDLGFTVSPNPLIETSKLTEITFTFNNTDEQGSRIYSNLGASPTVKPTIANVAGGTPVECDFVGTSTTTSNLAFKMTIPAGALTGPGKYLVTLPEKAILLSLNGNPGQYYTNEEYTCTFNYTGESTEDVNVSDDIVWYYGSSFSTKVPVNGSVTGLQMLYGCLENGSTLRVKSGRPNATITGPDNFSKEAEITQSRTYDAATAETVDQSAFQINCMVNGNTTLKTPGEYTVSIPAGALTVDGEDVAAFTATFTIQDNRTYTPMDFNFDVRPLPNDPELIALTYLYVTINRTNDEGKPIYHSLGVKHGAMATIAKAGGETVELPLASYSEVQTGKLAWKIDFPEGTAFKNGVYTVTIPQGSLLIGSEVTAEYYTNKDLVYTYKFEGSEPQINYTSTRPIIRPAQGDVKGLCGVQLETPSDAYYMYLGQEGTKFQLTLPDGTTQDYDVISFPSPVLLNIPFYSTYTEPGEYKLTIPRSGIKYVDANSGTEYYTTGFDIVYNVTGGESVEIPYTLATPKGEIQNGRNDVYSIDYVYLTFSQDVTPIDMIYSKVVYPDGSVKYARTTWSSQNKRFLIDFSFPTEQGLYTVTVPEGICYNANGEFNKALTFELNLLNAEYVNLGCTVDPADGSTVQELSSITLTAADGYSELRPVNGGITMTYFYNDETPDNRTMYYLSTKNETNLQIVLDNKVTEIGDYAWYIPENSIRGIKTDGSQVLNTAMTFTWSVRAAGVVGINGDSDTLYDVYTVNGTQVMKQVKSADLNRLPKGMYIINGRTYILR